jgi:hypothetical protein
MLVEYSKRVSLTEAVAQTFDGQHPCDLCHAVRKGKSSEKKTDLSDLGKVDLYCTPLAGARVYEFENVGFSNFAALALHRFDSPPTPPPRSAHA